jgi:hypothetical protein
MPLTDHPFEHPVDLAILSSWRKQFAAASAKYPPITFTTITSIKPWPPIGIANVRLLLDAMVREMGNGERPRIPANASRFAGQMGPPQEFFFAPQDALDCYRELARSVGEQVPLWSHERWKSQRWTYALYQLTWEPGAVSFRAPGKRIHCYPSGNDQGWFWLEEYQAPEQWRPVAEVHYWRLGNLWAASLEALDVWAKRRAGADNDQPGTEQSAEGERPHGRGRQRRYNPQKDQEIAEAWQHASASNISKKDFAKDNGMPLKALNQLLNRVRERRGRAE